jgi:DNA-3-methyladenine glycosylase II
MENKNYSNAFRGLKKDKVMKFLIKKFGDQIDIKDRYNNNYSKAVADLIIEQQISFKAAISIKKKFNDLISNSKNILEISDEELKSIGISSRKVEYIKNVYNFFYQKEIDFNSLTDKDIIDTLCEIKGVGSWTAQMFLIFILFREDVFSKKDLALINSIKINYNISMLSDKKLDELIKSWKPFNSIASLLLWKSIEEKQFYIK